MSDEEVAERAKEWPEKFCSLDFSSTRKDVHAAMGRPTAIYRNQIENYDQDRSPNFDRYQYGYGYEYEYKPDSPDYLLLRIIYDVDDRVQKLSASVFADFPCELERYKE
jgi:hypothetical protein